MHCKSSANNKSLFTLRSPNFAYMALQAIKKQSSTVACAYLKLFQFLFIHDLELKLCMVNNIKIYIWGMHLV